MNFPTTRCTAMLVLLCALPAQGVLNRSVAGAPAPGRPVVVELFTSQGCSSCPLAEALLGELASRSNVIALGFHVDYWDGIGWRDRYSMAAATERQQGYVDALRLSTAFTPQMVVDGRRSFVGSDRERVAAAILEAPGAIPIEAAVAHDQLVISLPESQDRRQFDVTVIAYLPRSTTRIGGGENAGRTLTEFNVVRQIRHVGSWDGKAGTLSVPLSSVSSDGNQVVVLVQQAHQGPIVAAVQVGLDRSAIFK